MTERKIPIPRPRTDARIGLHRQGSITTIQLGPSELLFVGTDLVAIHTGATVYFPEPRTAAEQRAVNSYAAERPHVRIPGDQFDFVVGAALSTAGLPLTRRGEDDNR